MTRYALVALALLALAAVALRLINRSDTGPVDKTDEHEAGVPMTFTGGWWPEVSTGGLTFKESDWTLWNGHATTTAGRN